MTRTQLLRFGTPLVLVVGSLSAGIAAASGAVQTAVVVGVVLVVVMTGLLVLASRERRRGNTAVDEPLVNVSVPTRRWIFGLMLVAFIANLALRIADGSSVWWVVLWSAVILGHLGSVISLRRQGLL